MHINPHAEPEPIQPVMPVVNISLSQAKLKALTNLIILVFVLFFWCLGSSLSRFPLLDQRFRSRAVLSSVDLKTSKLKTFRQLKVWQRHFTSHSSNKSRITVQCDLAGGGGCQGMQAKLSNLQVYRAGYWTCRWFTSPVGQYVLVSCFKSPFSLGTIKTEPVTSLPLQLTLVCVQCAETDAPG